MRLDVVDLSHYNTVKDFEQVKNSGLVGVILKATEGTSYIDPTFAGRYKEAKKVGLCVATYHFLRHGQITEQARFYQSTVNFQAGERVCIDYEHQDCTLDDLRAMISALRTLDGSLQITVYSGHLIKEQLGSKKDDLLASTSLWIAQYREGTPEWPTGTWPTWTLHQYSDGSVGGSPREVNGIVKPFDCNQFNGSVDNCVKWFGPAEEPQPAPTPPSGSVVVDITAPDGVAVSVRVNGEVR